MLKTFACKETEKIFNRRISLNLLRNIQKTARRKLEILEGDEILMDEFLKPMGISQYRRAKDINVPARRINEIVQGKRSIKPDTALRLSSFFGLSERF